MSDVDAILTPPETSVVAIPAPKLKRHFIAAALSAVVPGAGPLYLGKRRKAVVIFFILVAISIGFWPLRLPRSYSSLTILIWVLLTLSLYAVCEALFARDAASSGRLSRWWIFAAIPLHYLGFNLLFTSLLFGSGFHTARNLGSSMEPTLSNRERLVYDTDCYRSHPKSRGDIIIFHHADSLFIKRITAIGGDAIEGNHQRILLNGQPLGDPFISDKFSSKDPDRYTFGPVTVPRGKYFVLGDNPDMSLDSRTPTFGLVDENAIVGKALYSYQFINTPLSRRLDESR
jgi:signal peptidase I